MREGDHGDFAKPKGAAVIELFSLALIVILLLFTGIAIGIALCSWATPMDYEEFKRREQTWDRKEPS